MKKLVVSTLFSLSSALAVHELLPHEYKFVNQSKTLGVEVAIAHKITPESEYFGIANSLVKTFTGANKYTCVGEKEFLFYSVEDGQPKAAFDQLMRNTKAAGWTIKEIGKPIKNVSLRTEYLFTKNKMRVYGIVSIPKMMDPKKHDMYEILLCKLK